MSYHFEFDPANRIIRCHLAGHVSDEDLKEFYRATERQIARMSPRAGIADFSAVTFLDVSPETIRELAKLPPAMPDPSLPRIVLAPLPQVFGMARMFELQGEGTRPNLHIVRTEDEVWAILGVPEPKFQPLPD